MSLIQQSHRCRHGGRCAVGWAGNFVWQRIGNRKDGCARNENTIIGKPAGGFPVPALVTVLEKRLAFLGQAVTAEETLSASNRHGPGDSLSNAKRSAMKVSRRHFVAPAHDGADHFMTKNTIWRRIATPEKGVQVASTNRATGHAYHDFAALGNRFGKQPPRKRSSCRIKLNGQSVQTQFPTSSEKVLSGENLAR